MLNPLLLLPLVYRIAVVDVRHMPSYRDHVIFLLTSVLWVHGMGLNLAANAINRFE